MICYKLFAGNGASSSYLSILLSCIYNDFFSCCCYRTSSFCEDLFWFLNRVKISNPGILCSNYRMKIHMKDIAHTNKWKVGHLLNCTIGGDGNMAESWISVWIFMKCSVPYVFSQEETKQMGVVQLHHHHHFVNGSVHAYWSDLVAFTSLASQVRHLNPYLHGFRSDGLKQFPW